MTKFHVHFNAADMDGEAVLVFIKPESPERNSRIHAWQVLTGKEGSAEFFHYENHIGVHVASADSEPSTPLISDTTRIAPGQLYQAVLMDGSLALRLCPTSLAQAKLSPEQCGVMNAVNPYMEFDCHWFVDERPVVTMPRVDTNMTVGFEHPGHLYFTVAKPPAAGQTYSVKDFYPMKRYVTPVRAQTVDVHVTRKDGLWTFDFSSSN